MERKIGLDVIRIWAIIGVISLHLLGQGGILDALANSQSYWIYYTIEVICMCSVNLFALLSGFLGFGKNKLNSYRLFELIITMLFYCIIISIVLALVKKPMSLKNTFFSIFPFMGGNEYWYIVCYIPVALISPYINHLLITINNKSHKRLCCILIIVFSVIQTACIKDVFFIRQGYSIVWLLVLYIVGAYINRMNLHITRSKLFAIFIVSICILISINYIINTICKINIKVFVTYSSPFIFMIALSIFIFLKDITIKSGFLKKCIITLSTVAFDVFIIHLHPFIFNSVLKYRFFFFRNCSMLSHLFIFVISVITIYLVLTLIGIIRVFILKKIKLDLIWNKITKNRLSYVIDDSNIES